MTRRIHPPTGGRRRTKLGAGDDPEGNAALGIWEGLWGRLKSTWPDDQRPILRALYRACEDRIGRIVCALRNPNQEGLDKKTETRMIQEARELMGWLDPGTVKRPTTQDAYDRAALLQMHGVPIWNILMVFESMHHGHAGAPPKNRQIAILAAEEKLRNPKASWSTVARKLKFANHRALRLAVEGKYGLNELMERYALLPPNSRQTNTSDYFPEN